MNRITGSLLVCFCLFLIACDQSEETIKHKETIPPSLIPVPQVTQLQSGIFNLKKDAAVIYNKKDADIPRVINYFVDLVQRTTDIHFKIIQSPVSQKHDGAIVFSLTDIEGREAYQLDISPQRITVSATHARGLFYGAITLWQVITSGVETEDGIDINTLHINDAPRFPWRGMMLDVARHYMPPAYIRQFIDWMALHKLNVLHWHLTDDQGWRLQIRQYPRLTEAGAWRVPAGAAERDIDADTGKPRLYGGYYTREQIRDIVQYADDRFITIVPEIDMPGHAQAAIAAYPELGVMDNPVGISSDWGIHTYLYNVEESTFTFLENVLVEVMELFPGKYIHIGGDEAVKDQWQASSRIQARMQELDVDNEVELQSYFIQRIEKFLNNHGRQLIGWDEILEGGLSPNATVMSWRGLEGGIEAAQAGHDVVMSPVSHLYFDYLQSESNHEPPGRPRVISLKDVYMFEPVPEALDKTQVKHVLGAQANLWTEHMRLSERVTHAAFPRMSALAETVWSHRHKRNWADFLERLPLQLERYKSLGIDYAKTTFEVEIKVNYDPDTDQYTVSLSNQLDYGIIRYTLDGSEPHIDSPIYTSPLILAPDTTLRTATYKDEYRLSAIGEKTINRYSYAKREDDDLKLCSNGLALRLEDDEPLQGERNVFLVDLFDPCWIYEQVNLSDYSSIRINVGQIPYNFQLWKDIDKVVTREPATPGGELEIRLDHCEGEPWISLPLAAVIDRPGLTLFETPLTGEGVHDLCFVFTGEDQEPLWVIDWIQLLPESLTEN